MFKNGANTAMDLKTFENSNSNVNSDVLIRLDSGGDPTPRTYSGNITYNIHGLEQHIMTATGLGINITTIIDTINSNTKLFQFLQHKIIMFQLYHH